MIRLTCTDADTRRAYSRLLNAQIATQVGGQTGTSSKIAAALDGYRIAAARATAQLRRFPRSRTAHRPTTHASGF